MPMSQGSAIIFTAASTGSWATASRKLARWVKVPSSRPSVRREIEAEAVDAHLLDPVAQRVHDHPERVGMAKLERVPATGEVVVVARVVVHEVVVGGVVDAAEGQRRPEMVAFGGVVVDDVQDHLDPGIVHHLHEGLDLAQAARPQILGLRREEADGVVAPVVLEAALDEMAVVQEQFDREQLDRGDAQVLQVIDDRRAREALEGAALRLRHVRDGAW